MSTVPVGDCEMLVLSLDQFLTLMREGRSGQLSTASTPPSAFSAVNTTMGRRPSLPDIHADSITPFNPVANVDQGNEWLKDHAYIDMFGLKDAVSDARTALKQITLLGIMGDAYLTKSRAGNQVVIFKGRPGLRSKLTGTRYLRDNPIVSEADLVIGSKEMLAEAGKATRISIICLIAWDIVHELLQDKPSMTSLGVTILSDIFQGLAASFVGVGVGMLAAAGAPIVATFCITALATLVAGIILSLADKHYDLTEKAIYFARKMESSRVVESFENFSERLGQSYVRSHSSPLLYMNYP